MAYRLLPHIKEGGGFLQSKEEKGGKMSFKSQELITPELRIVEFGNGSVMVSTRVGMEKYISLCASLGSFIKARNISTNDTRLARCAIKWIAETDGHWWHNPLSGGPFHLANCPTIAENMPLKRRPVEALAKHP